MNDASPDLSASRASSDAASLALGALHVLSAGVIVCDAHGRVVLVNPSGEEILGQGALMGRAIETVFAPLEELRRHVRHDPATDPQRAELRLDNLSIGYQVSQGAAGELVLLFRDISNQVRLRAERDRLLQLSSVGEVLPAVLHELRNPLAAVTIALEVMVEGGFDEDPDERVEGLRSVLNELRRMGLIFQGIGAVGRTLRGPRLAAIDRAVHEVIRVMGHRARREGIELVCDVDPMPPQPFEPAVFKAIVFNLLTNALYACERHGRVIVTLRLHDDAGLLLRVDDDGRGMSPAELAECTRPFFTTRANGSGLGLLICKEAVDEAQGTLDIVSAPGEGTCVIILLPREI